MQRRIALQVQRNFDYALDPDSHRIEI